LQPESLDEFSNHDQVREVTRFGDIAVGVQVVGPVDVLRVGRGEHDEYGNLTQAIIGLNFGENFTSLFLRQIKIEQNEGGSRTVLERVLVAYKRHGLLAVARDAQPAVAKATFFEGLLDEANVPGVIFDQKNFHGMTS
jgi:hypothetical protein